ncbi:RIP metalloprotease RseP [Fluoribacter dumoffii]|uniref:RIP metalloprotease RseP n=1 Tax=Fluoribacter dumoffii TaxID=463 RepID=UPI002243F950|nr:RIP metalloprotease RseP [Fluoribacter dumoffii]MCW8386508.1 RIP metalloprotease RseP [Fluoribacter dumoffii]MCW8419562.1 RIP metalloprotease RseP [Fluoribacter dumoffii]MCW8455735.1 RIP metalloprotease RseP [Fluoribacter dumoffii]MCW8460186.1 RIP metalloprotease RseP [Fluoribacter dumoffii]MCW8483665.1 RIP metalloprotease RseP [Fluoribacter dumoffii]
MLLTLLYFLLALVLLVTVHEYGHFQVARWCGVKVLRFSFGFGPILARWRDKKGTEYAWSLFPLGGYVKMLDESEGDVDEKERHLAFNNQSLWKRAAIVLAGPFFNFIFAFVALWLVLVIGMQSLAPMIESVKPNSIAAKAGLGANEEIIALNDTNINSWRDFQYAIMPLVGSEETIRLTVKSLTNGHKHQVFLPLTDWQLDNKKPDPLDSLGIQPFIPSIPPIVGEVVPDSPAAKAGLESGDKILKVDGKPFNDWLFLVDYVQTRPDKQLTLSLKRNGKIQNVLVQTGSQEIKGKVEGFLGVRSEKVKWPANWLRLEREDPLTAVGTALKQTVQLTGTTFTLMGRLVTGRLGLNSISGPVGIAQGAGDSGRSGLTSYLFFLALVSISLGALNLLPIPMLDGGHLLYYLLEAIRRKPLSDGLKSAGAYLGLLLLAALMFIALTNDLTRLAG